MRASRWLTLVFALLALTLVAAACSDDDDDAGDDAETTTAADAAADGADGDTADTADAADTGDAEDDAAADDAAAADLAAVLDGLACTGNWENLTFGSTGAFAIRSELGGDGGSLTLELGGNVFGGAGGTVTLPYTIEGSELVVQGDGGFLGDVDVRVDSTGALVGGTLAAPPALGAGASVAVTELTLGSGTLHLAVDIDFGDGSAPAQSVVDADCG